MATSSRVTVVWSEQVRANLIAIHDYIGQFAPLAAQRFTARLVSAVESLAIHPNRGRPVGGGVRELVFVSPYCIRYRVTAEGVQVLRIRHGAQEPD